MESAVVPLSPRFAKLRGPDGVWEIFVSKATKNVVALCFEQEKDHMHIIQKIYLK